MVIITDRDYLGGSMRLVIFGANGQTGRLVTRRVLDAGHTAVAVTRNPGGFPFTDPRLEVVGADVRDAARGCRLWSTAPMPCFRRWACRSACVPSTRTRRAAEHRRRHAEDSGAAPGRRELDRGTTYYPNRVDAPLALRIVEPIITAPSARPHMTTNAAWRRSSATAVWTGPWCGRPDSSTCRMSPNTLPER